MFQKVQKCNFRGLGRNKHVAYGCLDLCIILFYDAACLSVANQPASVMSSGMNTVDKCLGHEWSFKAETVTGCLLIIYKNYRTTLRLHQIRT